MTLKGKRKMNDQLVAAVEDYLNAHDQKYPVRAAKAKERMREIVNNLKRQTKSILSITERAELSASRP